jgi:hypothetical protein
MDTLEPQASSQYTDQVTKYAAPNSGSAFAYLRMLNTTKELIIAWRLRSNLLIGAGNDIGQ